MPTIQTTRVFAEIEQASREGYATISAQGSSRSSKTYNILLWLINRAMTTPGLRISVVRATLPALRGSILVDFREILSRMGLYDERSFNKSDLTYHLPNGSWFEFFSTDSEQKLRGRKRDMLFVNEANELSYLEWQQLRMRTSGIAVLDYNPSFSDDHWLVELNNDPRTYHFITTYRDNPFLEQSIIDELESLRTKNKTLWQVYGLGQRAMIEGLVFPEIETVETIPETVRRRWLGIDFGYSNDPTAIVLVACDGDALYLDEVCYRTEMLSGDIIREIKLASLDRLKCIADSADPRLIKEIYRAGIDIHAVRKFPGSIDAGLSKMKQYRIRVTRRSINIAKELRNYSYRQDSAGRFINTPIDLYNHSIDAARYVVLSELLDGAGKGKGVRNPVFSISSQV